MSELQEYYRQRAEEYEQVYQKPERQNDLKNLRKWLPHQLLGLDLLEIACGTGYWTNILAPSTQRITAIDVNEEVLSIARNKTGMGGNVSFLQQDLWQLKDSLDTFGGLFGGFIWSHIPREELTRFAMLCAGRIISGGKMVFVDNRFIPGNSTPIYREDDAGNTYQLRTLQSGKTFEVLKNYPQQEEFQVVLADFCSQITWRKFDYYWALKCTKK